MADTPRVTVPVEPTPEMLKAGVRCAQNNYTSFVREAYRAMLSAAPAPEGGADNDDRITYSRLARALSCHPTVMVVERSDPTLELTAKSLEDTLEEVLPLATREEAPAPEGGVASERIAEIATWTDEEWETVFAHRPDLRDRMRAALATREEAPAEDDARLKLIQCIEQWDGETEYDADDLTSLADSILHAFNGPPVVRRADPVQLSSNPCQLAVATSSEAAPCPFCGCGMRVNYDPESEMYGPDGDHLPGCIIGNWDLHEYAFRPDALAAWNSRALRTQPPAREDAQPVAWLVGEGGGTIMTRAAAWADGKRAEGASVTPLYTHPAPDALRVAVEASGFLLDRLKDLEQDVNERDFYGHVHPAAARLRQALAALQAEQKGGA